MEETNPIETSFKEFEKQEKINRRKLLPWWVKVFCWIFMIFGLLGVLGLILGFLNMQFNLAVYGFETNNPISLYGFLIIAVFLFKGLTAYSLWFEKDYAIRLGKADAIIGIILSILSMTIPLFYEDGYGFTFRLELALLIPFLIKMNKIQDKWENNS